MTETLVEQEIETRSGDGYQVAEVDFPKRIVTVVAMPYEKPTELYHQGRPITEVVSRNAFAGSEKRASQIRANRDHAWDRAVGKIVGLHPSRTEGLVTEIKISRTPLGQETLELCDDDVLSASVGFGLLRREDGKVWDDAEVWERDRSVRRLNRLYLDHVALVPNPQYPDASVIDVRAAPPAAVRPADAGETPNRDSLSWDELRAAHAALNSRWAR